MCNAQYVIRMLSDLFIQHFISATHQKPIPINVDDDDDDNDNDKIMKDVDVHDRHSSIPMTHHHSAPTTSKDTHDIDSETDLESGRKSSEEELDNEDSDDSDLQHLDKASLKEKMLSEVCFL